MTDVTTITYDLDITYRPSPTFIAKLLDGESIYDVLGKRPSGAHKLEEVTTFFRGSSEASAICVKQVLAEDLQVILFASCIHNKFVHLDVVEDDEKYPIVIPTDSPLGELQCKVTWDGRVDTTGIVHIRAQNRPAHELTLIVEPDFMIDCSSCIWNSAGSITVEQMRRIINYRVCRRVLEIFTDDIVFAEDV